MSNEQPPKKGDNFADKIRRETPPTRHEIEDKREQAITQGELLAAQKKGDPDEVRTAWQTRSGVAPQAPGSDVSFRAK